MKILHINTEANKGGAAIACNRLNEALNNNGIISKKFNSDSLSSFDNKRIFFNLALEKVLFLCYQASSNIRFKFSNPLFGIDITKQVDFSDVDIIHFHWINNGFLSLRSLKKIAELKKPIVWTFHDMWAFTGGCFHSRECENFKTVCGNCFYLKNPSSNDLSAKIHKQKQEIFSSLNIHVVACSNWLGARAEQSSLFHEKKISVIPNSINVDVYKPINQIGLRHSLKLPENKFLILFAAVNLLDERKGIYYLEEAINKLFLLYPELNENIELVILGNVKNNKSLSFPCNHTLTGYIDNDIALSKYYSACNIFITSSLDENLPNTIMESLSCGTPVVAFNTGGIPDLIEHKKNGYLAEYKSAEDLANGIMWMYVNRANDEIKKNARNKVVTNYTYDIVAEKYIQLYESII